MSMKYLRTTSRNILVKGINWSPRPCKQIFIHQPFSALLRQGASLGGMMRHPSIHTMVYIPFWPREVVVDGKLKLSCTCHGCSVTASLLGIVVSSPMNLECMTAWLHILYRS